MSVKIANADQLGFLNLMSLFLNIWNKNTPFMFGVARAFNKMVSFLVELPLKLRFALAQKGFGTLREVFRSKSRAKLVDLALHAVHVRTVKVTGAL